MITYRPVVADDEAFLAEMAALFGQGPGSASIRPWGEPWDYGIIAQDTDERVGAGWYRREGSGESRSDEIFREVFVGVVFEHQGQGLGGELWARLIEAARGDGSLGFLIGIVTPDSAGWSIPRLKAAGFRKQTVMGRSGTWLLGPLHGDIQAPW